MKYFYYAVSIIATWLIITCVGVQDLQTPIQSLFPSDDVLRGTTVNGTTYYVYDKKFDAEKEDLDVVNFVLLVNAGSVYEDDNQLGLAHFVEHMAFNGTTNFPGNTIISELEKRNVRFGADLNAYTSFDHTVFFIDIPNNEENIDLALDILKEWAYNLSYEEDEIEKEKPVVLEEVRAHQETQYKIFLENLKFILRDSKYAERNPGGKMDVIEVAPRDVIKKFYDDWYVPDLMAVYVGGDVDTKEIEEKIRTRFSNTDKRKEITPVQFPIPLGEPDTMVVRKVEDATQDNTVRLNYIMPVKKIYTLDDVINDNLLHISAEVINKHLSNISVSEDAVVSAGSGLSYFISEYQTFDVSFQVPEDTYYEGMEIIFNVLATLKNTELDEEFITTVVDQFIEIIMEMEEEANYGFYSIFHDYRQTYPLFDIQKYRGIISEELKKRATPQAIRESINTLMSQSDLRLIVSANREGLIPNDEDIQALFTTTLIADNITSDLVNIRTIEEIEEDVARAIDTDSSNKATVSQSSHPDYEGVYYFETSNGFTVEYHREALYDEDIRMIVYGPGGTFHYTNKDSMSDYVVRAFMGQFLNGLTVADLSVIDYDTYKEQHNINASFTVDEIYQNITISSTVDEIDTVFKMPYLYFTASSFDSNIVHNIITSINSQIQNIFNNADTYFFWNLLNNYVYSEDPYYQGYFKNLHTYTITNREVERAIEVYNAMIAAPQNFNIIIYGDVPPSKIRRYVKKYIASIPRKSVPSIQAYHPMRKMDFNVVEQFKGTEQSNVFLGWGNEIGPQTIDKKDMVLMAFLEKLLTIQLSDVIREKEGGVYSISSFLSYVPIPILPYDESDARSIRTTLSIQFASEPSKADELRDKAVKVLEQLRDNPIDEALIDRAFAATKRTIDERDYLYWQYRNYYFNVFVLTNLLRAGGSDVLLDVLSEITPDDIQEFLRTLMSNADFFTYTLEPKMEF